MIDAAIQEGDYVIVEKARDARDGDIVIAEVDGGYTLKYLKKKDGIVFLRPANKDFKDIYPTTSFCIIAVVKAVVRKY
jgi:SOS-response transcriptional repressor LexA